MLAAGILCAVTGCAFGFGFDIQRYDGWYNNLDNPSWGSAGSDVVFSVPPDYADLTYKPSGRDRPNPRDISNALLHGRSGLPSYTNKTVLFVFFGQLIAYELVHASQARCPVELLSVSLAEDDPLRTAEASYGPDMPFVRSGFNKETGKSPNNPRKPTNTASSWIDGSVLYGEGIVWTNCLRSFSGGQLMTDGSGREFPGYNKMGIPLDNYPDPITLKPKKPHHMWMFGDSHVHQSPALASIALMWFRYHNHVARRLARSNPDWGDQQLFERARRIVIATWQNVVMYEWLPALLQERVPRYKGYNKHVEPGVTALFEAAAFRFGHSMVPPGLYIRDSKCNFKLDRNATGFRMCNSYWRSQELLQEHGVEAFIQGMASQVAEREDHILVEDLRGKAFGPLHYSRQDLGVLTVMRGRDHGLPDYNTVRRALGLDPIRRWADINHNLSAQTLKKLRRLYGNDTSRLDVFPGGLLEFSEAGPGPLFRTVIIDQFTRVRDGDRFWFENMDNELFSESELRQIRRTTFRDVILSATSLPDHSVQEHVFFWRRGDPCPQPRQLTEDDLEPCTSHRDHDYFAGSEIAYISAFTSLCLFPFVCILAAYLLYKLKQYQQRRSEVRVSLRCAAELSDDDAGSPAHSRSSESGDTAAALQWLGKQAGFRAVVVTLCPATCSLLVSTGRGNPQKAVVMQRFAEVPVWLSNNKRLNLLLLHFRNDCDILLQFPAQSARRRFVRRLKHVLKAHEVALRRHEEAEAAVFQRAVTKEKRQEMLTVFFKRIFAEVYNVHELGPNGNLGLSPYSADIADCQLSREEFAEALAMKPDSMFVNQMFSVIDREDKGHVTFRDVLYAVAVFSRGSSDDKLHLLFVMYDLNKSGTLDRQETSKMIRSMIDTANAKTNTRLDDEQLDRLVDQMFVLAGMDGKSSLKFDDFKKLFYKNGDLLQDVSLDWKGTNLESPKSKMPPLRDRIFSLAGTEMVELPALPQHYSRTQVAIKTCTHFVQNNKQKIVIVLLFFYLCSVIFSERFYKYAMELEHKGFRSILGYGVALSRGSAAAQSFTFSLLLLTMCRNTITTLRETILNLYVPFDSVVTFHKLVAYTALLFTVLHILGYCFNFYQVATQPVSFLCIFDEIYFRSDVVPDFSFWMYGNMTGATGYLLTLVCCIIYIFATQTARTHIFKAFWTTHKLFYLLYILVLLHGASRIIQDPFFFYYFLGPAIIFLIDKTISLSRNKKALDILSVELLPSDVTKIEIKRPSYFEYKSGQWVRIACLDLGQNEYHPLTLTSAPHEESLALHCRAVGPWSTNLRTLLREAKETGKFPQVYVDGPYGAGQQDWYKYDVSVLVGGGIGVTPYASILKDFVFMSSIKNMFRIKCKKLYFIWVTGSQKHYEWLLDIIKQVESVDTDGVAETHCFITQFFQKFDLRTTMLYVCEEYFQTISGKSMFTGLKAKTHFGRPHFEKILKQVSDKHPGVRTVGVFSCGPPGLTKGVERACYNTSRECKARFEHHFENF